MTSTRLRCKILAGARQDQRVAAVERVATIIRTSRPCFVRVTPTDDGVFCDLYLHGTGPLEEGQEFALRATGEHFIHQIIR